MSVRPDRIPRIRLLAGVLLPVVFIVGCLLAADAHIFRYRLERAPCLWQMMYMQNGPIDFVAVGGSRVMAAIHPTDFQNAYKDQLNKEVVVYNFARDLLGPDYSYSVIRDLFQRRSIRHLVIQAEKQLNMIYHHTWYSVARTDDLIMALAARPNNKIEHVGAMARLLLKRMRYVLVADSIIPISRWERSESGVLNTCYQSDPPLNLPRVVKAQDQLALVGYRETEFDITDPNQEYQLFFYRKLVNLAHEHGAQVSFVHLPKLASADWGDSSKTKFEAAVGARLLQLPQELRNELGDSGYRDSSHLHAGGRKLFLPWLISALGNT